LGKFADVVIVAAATFCIGLAGFEIHAGTPGTYWTAIVIEFLYAALFIGLRGSTPGMGYIRLRCSDAADGEYPIGMGKASLRAGAALVIAIVPRVGSSTTSGRCGTAATRPCTTRWPSASSWAPTTPAVPDHVPVSGFH
jgi:uncharacterized RDD family membrane protein YckC